MKQKTKKLIEKYFNAFSKDDSYNRGGWMFFLSRLVWNYFILYYLLAFMKGIVTYAFISQGLDITPERLELVRTLVWAAGVIYLVVIMLRLDGRDK